VATAGWRTTRIHYPVGKLDAGWPDPPDVVQPDIDRVGGITEAMRVVQMALDRGKIVVPHCRKTGISVAATAHVAAAAPNCRFMEIQPSPVAHSRLRRGLVEDELKVVNGKIHLPLRPGLGIELRPATMAEFAAAAEKRTGLRQE
jgi:L-alanine-DL-glutamate epimerase-like enolase superfamily enzyme